MLRILSIGITALAFLNATSTTHAEVLTIEATVKSVDTKSRSITVERKGKTKDLDVSRKVKIQIDGEQSSLDALKEGQKISLSYHTDLEIVLEIDVNSEEGGISLFNGNDLSGWKFIRREGGNERATDCWDTAPTRNVLICLGHDKWSYIQTEKSYQDFTLTMEWRFIRGGKMKGSQSGVVVRSDGQYTDGASPRGVEINIYNRHSGGFITNGAVIHSEKGEASGERPMRLDMLKQAEKPIGQWNEYQIECKEDRIQVTLNGELVNRGWEAKKTAGPICLVSQGATVEFRNIILTPNSSEEVSSTSTPEAKIPPDATLYGGHHYKVFSEVLPWSEAKAKCEEMGGYLTAITNAKEQRFLTRLTLLADLDVAWLGGSDEKKEGRWLWTDGSRFTYTNWMVNQPNNKKQQEHYIILWATRDGLWCDQPNLSAEHQPGFICEWD